jgi:hypothetical protein
MLAYFDDTSNPSWAPFVIGEGGAVRISCPIGHLARHSESFQQSAEFSCHTL